MIVNTTDTRGQAADSNGESSDGYLSFAPEAAPRGIYQLLISVILPRPIAWISSQDATGVLNLAPYSYCTILSHNPPMLGFTSTSVKDTLRNIQATGECVINVASADLVDRLNLTSADFPSDHDEFAWAGLTPVPSVVVSVPSVGEAPVSLEMRLVEVKQFGDCYLTAGEVVHVRLRESIVRDGKVLPELLDPLGRGAGWTFFRTPEAFDVPRPKYAQLLADGARPARPATGATTHRDSFG